jgi:hypothetical protein
MYFDQWNQKYFKVAKYVKNAVALVSHKFFQMPYTHFYGYLHMTLRIQDHFMAWEWNFGQWQRWRNGSIPNSRMMDGKYLFHGRLVVRKDGPEYGRKEPSGDDGPQYEGGKKER